MVHKAKKSLGQNFLKSNPALNMMCSASELEMEDTILEIGPGKGALTKKILEKARRVVAVEKDKELIKYLQEKFEDKIKSNQLTLIEGDILSFDDNNFSKNKLLKGRYKIIANIPYNITGLLLKKFLASSFSPSMMTLMVQKEVAKRIIGNKKFSSKNLLQTQESILSLSVKAYGNPKYIMKVGKRFFSPSPKVDSAIISIKNISNNNFKSKQEEEVFFRVVKAGFSHKRKILKKNLEILEKDSGKIDNIFEKLKINPKIRAEDFPFNSWLELARYFL